MIARQVKVSLILNRENLETKTRKWGLSSVKDRSLMFGMVLGIFSFNEEKVVLTLWNILNYTQGQEWFQIRGVS